MRGAWSAAAAPPNEFCLPHEVFKLGLGHGPLPVYLYLIYCKSMGHRADKMSCTIISKATADEEDRNAIITSVLEPIFAPKRKKAV